MICGPREPARQPVVGAREKAWSMGNKSFSEVISTLARAFRSSQAGSCGVFVGKSVMSDFCIRGLMAGRGDELTSEGSRLLA